MSEGPDGPEGGVIDARGLRCPVPVIELQRAARRAQDGELLTLLSDDVATEGDVAAWCEMQGHDLVRSGPAAGGGTAYVVRIRRP
jgi:TusA-related sulfurtransferase